MPMLKGIGKCLMSHFYDVALYTRQTSTSTLIPDRGVHQGLGAVDPLTYDMQEPNPLCTWNWRVMRWGSPE